MANQLVAACVQTNSGSDVVANLAVAANLIHTARDAGAELIALPEHVALMEANIDLIQRNAIADENHHVLAHFCTLARGTGAWLLAGTLPVLTAEGRIANRSILIDDQGAVVATYDKIHMFDVDLPNAESYCESAVYTPGNKMSIAATPWCSIGMTVCYDLRFSYLYRSLAQAGAQIITVPSAFTKVTGEAHWNVLLRARAIETGCFVIAAAQCGSHYEGRETFGHSLIVDPWGEVLADAGENVGVVIATLDLDRVGEVRGEMPSLTHDREFLPPTSKG